jgi:hypothetical protein
MGSVPPDRGALGAAAFDALSHLNTTSQGRERIAVALCGASIDLAAVA